MTWSALEVETLGLFLTALAVATTGGTIAMLRPSRPGGDDQKELQRRVRRDASGGLIRRYALGGLAAIGAAGALGLLRIPLASQLSLGIVGGAAAAIVLAFVAFEVVLGTSVRIVADAEVEQMARARRASVVGATALGALVLTVGLVLTFGTYFITNGAVPDLFGIAVGVGLVSLVSTAMDWLPTISKAPATPSRSTSDVGFLRRAIGSSLRCVDLLAVVMASVASAMFIGYRDQFALLLFPNSTVYPALVASVGILALLAGASVWVVGRSKGNDLGGLYTGLIVAAAVGLVGQLALVVLTMNGNLGIFVASAMGTAGGAACLVPFLATRTGSSTPSASDTPVAPRRMAAQVLGVALIIALVAIVSYWAASQLVVTRGQNPIPDLGFYGLALSAVGLVSILAPGLLVALLPDLGASAIELPRTPGQLPLPRELTEDLRKGSAATQGGAFLFTLCASGLCSLGLIAAGRIATANVLGDTVVGVVGAIHQALWVGAIGFALGVLAAVLLVWVVDRARGTRPPEGSSVPDPATRDTLGVPVVLILIATLGSLGINWVWGTNAAFGLALGLLVVGLPLAVASGWGSAPDSPSTGTESSRDEPRNASDVDRIAVTWSEVIRTTFLLSAFAIVPFASAVTSFYKG